MSLIREQIVKRLTRSRGWSKLRKRFIRAHPYCAVCGRVKRLEVHHVKDVSTYPELELEWFNLITLCGKRCHIFFGHLCNWKSINSSVIEDAEWFSWKVANRR